MSKQLDSPRKGKESLNNYTGWNEADQLELAEDSMTPPDRISATLGYEMIGPLCYGFANWLVRKAKETDITHLYFLSRDGWLLKQAFDLLPATATSGIESHYLYSSRRAVWFASLKQDTSEREFNEILSGASPYLPVKEFLLRIFIDPTKCHDQIREAGFANANSLVETTSDKHKLYELFKAIKPQIVANAARERKDYLAYLTQAGIFDQKKSGLVDVGWTGSILKYTRALAREVDDSIDLYGFFVGVGENARKKYKFSKNDCLHGYLFNFDDDTHFDVRKHFFVIEKFLSPNEPTLIKIIKQDNEFRPIYKPGEQEASPFSASVQKHALQFVKDSVALGAVTEAQPEKFLPKLKKVLTDPDPEMARFLSQYSYSSDFGYQTRPKPYAKSEHPSVYLNRPIKLFKDYRRAIWKAGFVAQQPWPAKFALRIVRGTKVDKLFDKFVLSLKSWG